MRAEQACAGPKQIGDRTCFCLFVFYYSSKLYSFPTTCRSPYPSDTLFLIVKATWNSKDTETWLRRLAVETICHHCDHRLYFAIAGLTFLLLVLAASLWIFPLVSGSGAGLLVVAVQVVAEHSSTKVNHCQCVATEAQIAAEESVALQ